MSNVTQERQCPFCEQIVPREQKGVFVRKFPNPVKLFHDGCASLIYAAYSDKHFRMEAELSESDDA
jgi:hypothetical protein